MADFDSFFFPSKRPVNDPRKVAEDYELERQARAEEAAKNAAGYGRSKSVIKDGQQNVEAAPIDAVGTLGKKEEPKKTEEPKNTEEKPASSLRKYISDPVAPVGGSQTQEVVQRPPKEEGFPWDRALIGATPLLVGLLTGNTLEGTQIAGDTLAKTEADRYKRGNDLENKLAELAMKRKMGLDGGKVNGKTFEYQGSDGKNRIGRFVNGQQFIDEESDPLAVPKGGKDQWQKTVINTENGPKVVYDNLSTGERREAGEHYERPQYSFQTVGDGATKDPTDEERIIVKNGKYEGTLGPLAKKGDALNSDDKRQRQLSSQQFQALNNYTKPTGEAGKHREKMGSIIQAAGILNEGGPIGESGLPSLIARGIFGETGVLTEPDVRRVGGDPSLVAISARLWGKAIKGEPLEESDREDIYKVLKVAHRIRAMKMAEERDAYIKAYKNLGIDVSDSIRDYTRIPDLPSLGPRVLPSRRSQKATAPVRPPYQPLYKKGQIVEGYEFLGGDDEDPKNYRKVK
jgi:hypothetical protein